MALARLVAGWWWDEAALWCLVVVCGWGVASVMWMKWCQAFYVVWMQHDAGHSVLASASLVCRGAE